MTGRVTGEARALWAAAIFFTRLPLPSLPLLLPEDERRATAWWPLVGIGVAAAVACVWAVAVLALPGSVAAGLAIAAGLLLTGGLHEDGFADVCDGLGGVRSRERALEIMRDSRLGAFGVTGLILLLGLKWQAMAALPQAVLPATLIAATAASRGAALAITLALPYARSDGRTAQRMTGQRMTGRPGARVAGAAVFSILPLLLLAPVARSACLAAAVGVSAGCFLWFRRRLGGYTGDCLGFTQQLGEVAIFLAALAST